MRTYTGVIYKKKETENGNEKHEKIIIYMSDKVLYIRQMCEQIRSTIIRF